MKKENAITKIAIFQKKEIRKIIQNKEWWFSILDVIRILTDSPQPKTYWAKMKERDKEMSQPFPFWEQLKIPAEDGKMRATDCADTVSNGNRNVLVCVIGELAVKQTKMV